MTDLSRRNFLIGAGAVAATATVIPFPQPLTLIAPPPPLPMVELPPGPLIFSAPIPRAGSLLWQGLIEDAIIDGNGDRIISFTAAADDDYDGPEVRDVAIARDPETHRLVFTPTITEVVFIRAGKTYVRRGDVEHAVDADEA